MKSALFRLLLLAVSLPCVPLLGQGCVQCATSAHGAGPQGERALFKGMLVLLAPSLAMLSGIAIVTYRNRK
jgi:hypothetical protein